MTQSVIQAGDSTANSIIVAGGDDGTLALKVGAAGAKVNAVTYAGDGTPTQIKGTTVGSAPMAVPSGSAPLFAARAWCFFDGTLTGTNVPTAGGNVSTVTRSSTGVYVINFATAMPDLNYSVLLTPRNTSGNSNMTYENLGVSRTTTSVGITNLGGGAFADSAISVLVFR